MAESKQSKTERATPQRKRKARREGQVVKSNELKSALVILSAVTALRFLGPWMRDEMLDRFTRNFSSLADIPVTEQSVMAILVSWGMWWGQLVAPVFLLVAFVAVAASGLIQGGFVLSTQRIGLNVARLNPVTGAARLMSGGVFFNLVRDIFKVILIGYVCYRVVKDAIILTLERVDIGLGEILSSIGRLTMSLCFKAGVVLLLLGLVDYVYQRRRYFTDLKMTKREVKDERKETEGHPTIKGRIRSAQMKLAYRRMMQAVPKADVVLTNPTEIAVALRYDPEKMGAPQVVAKGQRLVAQKIKEVAEKSGVPIVEDKLLARSLFRITPLGGEIPVELYRAVAEILSYVYRLKGRLSPLGQST